MGNKQSVQEHTEFTNIAENYEFEKKYTDDRLGEIRVLNEKQTGIKIYQKDFNTNSVVEYKDYIDEVQKRVKL